MTLLGLILGCTSPSPDSALEDSAPEDDTGSPCETSTWFEDADGDGFGAASSSLEACEAPEGHVDNDQDCDDSDAEVHPQAQERCLTQGVDDDCDGELDEAEAVDAKTWYADADGDSYGDAASTTPSCGPVEGYVDNSEDCDDADPEAFPGAAEICDGKHTDC